LRLQNSLVVANRQCTKPETRAVADTDPTPGLAQGERAIFPTTRWSDVLRAGHTTAAETAPALERLCQTYWYPLYAFVRRRGHDAHEAEDLTQSFFAHLFEHDALKGVTEGKAKFRSFLLAALTNFLNNEWDKRRTQKRGGLRQIVSWEDLSAEELYRQEPADNLTPAKLFERRWACTLVDCALGRLRREYEGADKLPLFEKLEPFLTTEAEPGFHAETAAQLKMSEGAVKVALHRLRRRFGELLRSEVAYTVADPEQIEEEIRSLFAAMAA